MTVLTVLAKDPARKGRNSLGRNPAILRGQSGQSLVEVALVTPLLLAMLFGAIEFGRFAYISILVENAARAGAAYGSIGVIQSTDTTGIEAAADNDFQGNGQSSSDLTVSSTATCGCDSDGAMTTAGCTTENNPTAGSCTAGQWQVMISVTASGTFHSIFQYPWVPNSITLSRTVILRVNQYGG